MEYPISISNLNDFIFCPASIYFHALDADTNSISYQDTAQIDGTAAHQKVDSATYSTRKNVLQGIDVYCEKYNIYGCIDIFDVDKGLLTERKKKIKTVYDGYVFQVYAQYFGLKEQGYEIRQIRLYSMDDNKIYKIALPCENAEMLVRFEELIRQMNDFDMQGNFRQENKEKCLHCIYSPMCSYSRL